MNAFLYALQFLTILPVKIKEPHINAATLSSSKIYFPLIGAFLGFAMIVLYKFFAQLLPRPMISLILVTALAVLTGALHLDGLADTCDALASRKTKEEMLLIMRDSHKGTFGVLGIIFIILFKISLLSFMPQNLIILALLLMTTLSRYCLSFSISFFPYARQEGKAKIFFERKSPKFFLTSTLITIMLSVLTGVFFSFLTLFLVIGFTLIFCSRLKYIFGGLTGDILGALCELSEVVILLSIFIFAKIYP